MTLIALLSSIAIVIGVLGIAPQLTTMLRARSSAGQSSLAWSLGVFVNVLMAYVNLAGYQAPLLAGGNMLSATMCATALLLVVRYRAAHPAAGGAAAPIVHELPTSEFVALREMLESEARRRDIRALPAAA
jgi:hypothetical protein